MPRIGALIGGVFMGRGAGPPQRPPFPAAALPLLLAACTSEKPADTAPTPVPAPDPLVFAGRAYHAGDPHVHTEVSGDAAGYDPVDCPGCGRFGEVFDRARAAGLSWVALSDHVNGYPAATERGFADQQAAVRAANDPAGGFVTLPSAEVWFQDPAGDLGHKTLLLFGDETTGVDALTLADVQPVGTDATEVAGCADIWAWADALDARVGPLLLVPHHPAGHQPMPTDWSCADADRQPIVEVYSEHGSALDDGFDPPWAGTTRAGTVPHALDPDGPALRMGFVGGTDGHDTLPGDVCALDLVRDDQPYGGGLTMVPLPEGVALSREALHDAFVARRTYATSGPRVALDVAWSSDGATLGGMGDLLARPTADLTVTVRLPEEQAAAVTGVEVVGPGAFGRRDAAVGDGAWTLTIPPDGVPAWLYVAVALDGEALHPEGCDDGGADATEWAWASPTWFE